MRIDKIRNEMADEFFAGILTLQDIEECYRFFDDLATLNEIKTMIQRYQVAKMLDEQKTYTVIEEETHASTATIARVKRSLQEGNGSYEMVFRRLEMAEFENQDNA